MNEIEALILAAYEQAELRLLEKVNALVMLGLDEADTLQGQKLQQLRTLRQETIKILKQLASLDDEAKQGIIKTFLQGNTSAGNIQGTSSAALNNLVADYLKLLQQSRFQILRQTEDSYRTIVAQVTQSSALGVDTRIQTARRALQQFANQGITAFVSADGRRWEIRSYVEAATRTTLLNAQREGRLANIDGDLIIINAVPNPSDLCKPYERKVLSISGDSDRYPSLAEAKANGLFHVNCRHSFTKYVPGLTKRDAPDETDDYEETQEQRYLERQTRKWKRRQIVADTPADKQRAQDKIKEYQGRIKELTEEFDLVRKRNRESNISAR